MADRGEEIPVLIGQSGPINGQRWTITKTMVIGRDASCDIVIPDRQISRFHANLMPAANGTILEDLGSKNGTYCNGQKVETSVMLADGDLVQMALVQHFVFLSSELTLPLDASQLPVSQKRTGKLHFDNRSQACVDRTKRSDPTTFCFTTTIAATALRTRGSGRFQG